MYRICFHGHNSNIRYITERNDVSDNSKRTHTGKCAYYKRSFPMDPPPGKRVTKEKLNTYPPLLCLVQLPTAPGSFFLLLMITVYLNYPVTLLCNFHIMSNDNNGFSIFVDITQEFHYSIAVSCI